MAGTKKATATVASSVSSKLATTTVATMLPRRPTMSQGSRCRSRRNSEPDSASCACPARSRHARQPRDVLHVLVTENVDQSLCGDRPEEHAVAIDNGDRGEPMSVSEQGDVLLVGTRQRAWRVPHHQVGHDDPGRCRCEVDERDDTSRRPSRSTT